MPRKQEQRSEETRQSILAAAGQLFSEKGYEAVTMRQIAALAGCSHTAIYVYFRDKETLLHQLAMGPLLSLQASLEAEIADRADSAEERLKQVSRGFIRFCFTHRSMYPIFFMAKASRVDEADPALEIQRLRNQLFGLLRRAVGECLPPGLSEDRVLAYTRIYFFTLHGIIGTYAGSEEPIDALMVRLLPTFDLAIAVLVSGFRQTAQAEA